MNRELLYPINDALAALAAELGVPIDDSTLDELTHHVADTFATLTREEVK